MVSDGMWNVKTCCKRPTPHLFLQILLKRRWWDAKGSILHISYSVVGFESENKEELVIGNTVTLYRPTGSNELALVRESGYKRWPPRLPGQPIFYPVTNEEYATEITLKWNVPAKGVGYVTKFEVNKSFIDRYEIQQVGASRHTEWWIPAEDLEELNDNIVGLIEVIAEYATRSDT